MLPMYNAHPYFPSKIWAKNCIIHGKIWYIISLKVSFQEPVNDVKSSFYIIYVYTMGGREEEYNTSKYKCFFRGIEKIKLMPFAIMAPFAEHAYDLVKHDCHFTLQNLCPKDWKLLKSKTRI